jgi:hypothetical protein
LVGWRARYVSGRWVCVWGGGGAGRLRIGPPLGFWGCCEFGDISVDAGFDTQPDAFDTAGCEGACELVGLLTALNATAGRPPETYVGLWAEFKEVRPEEGLNAGVAVAEVTPQERKSTGAIKVSLEGCQRENGGGIRRQDRPTGTRCRTLGRAAQDQRGCKV